MANALSRRTMSCGTRLAAMGIQYSDQKADVYDRELVAVMAKLAISPTVLDRTRQTQDANE